MMGMVGLAVRMAVDAEAGSVTVKFLHPHLPSSSFTFPDMLKVDSSDTASQVNPVTATGKTYTLTKREIYG